MNITLTQKERMLLEDQKNHELLCIQKYNNYANQVQDPQLKQMFLDFAAQEQKHLDTINQILNGQVPNVNQGQQQGQQQNQMNQQSQQPNQMNQMNQNQQPAGMQFQKDSSLCNDLLMTEKYVSGSYNVAIFEFANPQIRDVLNHIQKEEQKHGEGLFNYMNRHGMYNPK